MLKPALCLCTLLLILRAPLRADDPPQSTRSRLLKEYNRLRELQESRLDAAQEYLRQGRFAANDVLRVRAALAETRIHIAEIQGQPDAILRELRSLIAEYEQAVEKIRKLYQGGRSDLAILSQTEEQLIRLRIRLILAEDDMLRRYAPTTQPTTQPAERSTTRSTTRPATRP